MVMVMAVRSFWMKGGVGCLISSMPMFSILAASKLKSGELLTRVF
jgi:hypothetical protein